MFRFLQSLFGSSQSSPKQMLRLFESQQQQLRDAFFQMASSSGKPRGLIWKGCDWLDTQVLTRDTESQLLTLFIGINLSFEAEEGGDMEDVEAVSMIRDATAVFHAKDGRWGTGGRVLFNMDPKTAAQVVADGQETISG